MSDLAALPGWAKTLQRRIRQRGIDFFILHGPGVRDLHPLGARRFGTIADCLGQVILNDRGAGIGFSDRDVENDFKMVLKAYDKLGGTNLAQVQPRDPDRALQLIETYLRYQLGGNPRFSAAVLIDYGETVAPAGEPGQLPAEDRGAIVTLRRWASEPVFLQRSVTFCLLVETTATLSAALVSDARTFEIAVPVPDEQERYAYLAGRGSRPETFATVDARRVAILTAGLTRLHLESLLAEAGGRRAARSGRADARKEAPDRGGERGLTHVHDQPGGARCGRRARGSKGIVARDGTGAVAGTTRRGADGLPDLRAGGHR